MAQGTIHERRINRLIKGQRTSDGAGVRMNRLVGTSQVEAIGPILMLDHFGSNDPRNYINGFPSHPHRGFETITLMLEGRMCHQDHMGNSGLLLPGHVQWMTAAKGVIHSEMPEQIEGRMAGFQLWLNLPKKHKMDRPSWQDFTPEDLQNFSPEQGIEVALVAGFLLGKKGPVQRPITKPIIAMIHMAPGKNVSLDLPPKHANLVTPWEGTISIAGRTVPANQAAELDEGGILIIRNTGEQTARLLLAAARPLNEPVVRYGPFVMTSEREIHQAIKDFQTGRF